MARELQSEDERHDMLPARMKEQVDVMEVALESASETGNFEGINRVVESMEKLMSHALQCCLRGEKEAKGATAHNREKDDANQASKKREKRDVIELCIAQYERAERLLAKYEKSLAGSPINSRGSGADSAAQLGLCLKILRQRRDSVLLARSLRETRRMKGLSQKSAASLLDISAAYLSRIERASCSPPSRRVMKRISAFLRKDENRPWNYTAPEDCKQDSPFEIVAEGGAVKSDDQKGGIRQVNSSPPEDGEAEGDKSPFPPESILADAAKRSELIRSLLAYALKLSREDLEMLVEVLRALAAENV